MLRSTLMSVRDRSFWLLTINYIVGQQLYRSGMRKHLSGATHARFSVDQGVDYVVRVFRDYLEMGGLSVADLAGKSVLEVGPGDNLGVAALFAAAGASRVVCLDRFDPSRDESRNRDVYKRLTTFERAPAGLSFARVFDAAGDLAPGVVEYRTDVPIERARDSFPAGSFDLIVSRAVLEHVFDVDTAWASMDALLAPGGRMLHKVDFRNHGFYGTLHPLGFLMVPEPLWSMVSSPDPTLNRRRMASYERLAEKSGYDYRVGITHLASGGDEFVPPRFEWTEGREYTAQDLGFVRAVRHRLAEPFISMDDRELLVNGIFLAARKAGG
jgi:SAM-dependent methyltransferase